MDRDQFLEIRSRWFSPLQMLELDACTRCQQCIGVCPVVGAGFPDGAMERIAGWRRLGTPSNRIISLLKKTPSFDADQAALFSSLSRCTSCGACSVVCESGISCTALWESMMGTGREMGFCDPAVEQITEKVVRDRNPFCSRDEERTAWIPAGIRIADSAPIGLFIGCTTTFRQPEIGQAALKILERSQTRFCMLAEQESCCGSVLFRTGSWSLYAKTVISMIERLRERGVETLLVLCAGCLKTISIDWPRIYGQALPFRPMPISVFLRDLVQEGKIRFVPTDGLRVAYHDPCHGGRHLAHHLGRDWVFEAPREVLSAIPGLKLEEFVENREHQICCGAGGGIKAEDPDLALKIAGMKIGAVDRMDVGIITSTCPFCRRNLSDACEAAGSPVEVLDLIQVVDRMMEP